MRPSFIVLGAQKAATSLLQDCLREHPQVFMPGEETEYFEDPAYQQQTLAQFEALFDRAPKNAVIGIKRADYLARPECPERIHRCVPDARLLAVLRNPVERAVSAYFWYLRMNFIPLQPLNEGIHALLNGSLCSTHPKAAEILSYGLYHQSLQRYLAFFPREQMQILLYDDVRADAALVLSRACTFVGVDANFHPASLASRPKKTIYSLERLRILTRPGLHPHVIRFAEPDWRLFSGEAWRKNAQFLAKVAVVGTDRLVLARLYPGEKPKLDPGLRQALADYYRDDIGELEALLNRDLARWVAEKN